MRWLAWIWGVGGLSALLLNALWKLAPLSLEALQQDWSAVHWIFAVPWVLFMAYAEGYRGFQKGYSPRVVRRAVHLFDNPNPLHLALAPAFLMGLFHATRKRMIVAWCLVLGVTALVVIVGQLGQPWRGIVDLGVLVGLTWGLVAIWVFAVRALGGNPPEVDPMLPTPPGAPAAEASGSPG
ncbi:MAG: hypothetical protein GY913_05390 [Proteobacteria bacterium]|nr:hypothetical protein [Pseudomonadota bacterium]MCP4916336.1 hypothetical protein [Pseudomonadota bacterium]